MSILITPVVKNLRAKKPQPARVFERNHIMRRSTISSGGYPDFRNDMQQSASGDRQ